MDEFDNNDIIGNNHTHGGYTPKQLYIEPRYSTFKEELSNYKYIRMKDYNTIIKPKVTAYMRSKKVKAIKVISNK